MVALVLDCSAVAGWCFEDEKDSWADKLLARVVEHEAIVPSHWHLEVANMLLQAHKRKRISEAEIAGRLEWIAELPIVVDEHTPHYAFHETTQHAARERLTSYDAAYLELAMRQGLPLATKDSDLKKACRRLGVACL